MRRTSQTTFTRLVDRQGRTALHRRAALDRRGRRREGRRLVAGGQGEARRPGEIIPQIYGTLDLGFPLPLPHSSIWLRSAAGGANGDRNNTSRQFLFRRLRQQLRRQRTRSSAIASTTSLPGFEIDEVSGLNFVREMVEWNLPPVVFESVGTPGFHLTWLRPAIFATALWTDVANPSQRQNYANVGTQVDLQFSVLHWYDMTLSVGYRGRLPGRQARGHRVDDLAQDHVAPSLRSCRLASCAGARRPAAGRDASSPRCSISTATSS